MSSFTLFEATIPQAIAAVNTLIHLLDKLEAHAAAKNIKPEDLVQARLAPDMLPFAFQVQFASDTASKLASRLQDIEPPTVKSFTEVASVADLREITKQVLEHLNKADKSKIVERADAQVTFGMGPGKSAELKACEYAAGYGLPNIFFHTTTAYAILRKEGVEIGKPDYLKQFIGPFFPQGAA